MNAIINFLTLMTLLFATLAQTNSVSKGLGYGVAGACAGITIILAILRYNRRKAAGE